MIEDVRAVAFDLGGVLIRIHHCWEDAILAAGVDCNACGPLGGFPDFDAYQRGAISEDAFTRSLADFLGTDHGSARNVHMDILRDEYEGVTNLVRELTSLGVCTGCISNTNALHWETFFDGNRYAFGPLLQVRIGSHRVNANKPDESIYREYERASGFNGPKVVFFDDSLVNVEAAWRIGWRAWRIDPEGDTAQQMRGHLGL